MLLQMYSAVGYSPAVIAPVFMGASFSSVCPVSL